MRAISPKIKKILLADKFMEKCCICGSRMVVFHHAVIFAGRQLDEVWAIVPVCDQHHKEAHSTKWRKAEVMNIAIGRATKEDLAKYPKRDWEQLKRSNKYEENKHKTTFS
jgi:hypothetical protein